MEIVVAGPQHAEQIAEIYRPIVTSTSISFETSPPDGSEMTRRIEATLERFPWLVALAGREVTGYAYAHPFAQRAAYAWAVETSIYVRGGDRGKGTGRALYGRLLSILQELGYLHAFAGIALPNAASVALHEALGFSRVGTYHKVGWKLGAWHDVSRWQLNLGPQPDSPEPPARFGGAV